MTEDRRNNRITHEADVAEHQCEADGAAVVFVLGHVAWQQEGGSRQGDVGDGADEQQWQNEPSVG